MLKDDGLSTAERNRRALKAWRKVSARYAGERRSLWTAEDAKRAHDGPHYDRIEMPPGVIGPKPAHMLREQARRAALPPAPAARAAEPDLVTEHIPPWRQVAVSVLPSAAASFAKAAAAAGLTVAARAAGDAVQVGIRERDRNALWMRATWIRMASGLWTTKGVSVGGAHVGTTAAKALWR